MRATTITAGSSVAPCSIPRARRRASSISPTRDERSGTLFRGLPGRCRVHRRAARRQRGRYSRLCPALRPAADACRQGGRRGGPVRRADRQRLAYRRADDAALRRAFPVAGEQPRLARARRTALVEAGAAGRSASLRVTVLTARVSRSKPDQGILSSLAALLNQDG